MAPSLPKGFKLPGGLKLPAGLKLPRGLKLPGGLKLPSGLQLPGGGGGADRGGGGDPRRVVLVELDDAGFTATVAELGKGTFQISECHREGAPAPGETARTPTQWLFERGHIDLELHLLLPDDVARLHQASLPRQSGSERKAAILRLARQGCGLEAEVLHTFAKRGKGEEKGSVRLDILAVERHGLVAEVLDNPDLNPGTVLQREQAWAAALPADLPEHVLVVDGPPEAPELLRLHRGEVISREVLDGTVPGELRSALPPALAAACAPPSTEEETAQPGDSPASSEAGAQPDAKAGAGGDADALTPPGSVVFAPSLGLNRETASVLSGELEVLSVPRALTDGIPGWESGEAEAVFTTPNLASLGALRQLARGGALLVLPLGAPVASGRSRPPPKVLAAAGLALALLAGCFAFGGDEVAYKVKKKKRKDGDQVAQAKTDTTPAASASTAGGADASATSPGGQTAAGASGGSGSTARGASTGATSTGATSTGATSTGATSAGTSAPEGAPLGRRMAASVALGEACNRVTEGVLLDRLSVEREGGLVIEGVVNAPSRLDGLRALAAYRASLLELPFVESMVESIEYHDLDSGAEELGFRLSATWTGGASR